MQVFQLLSYLFLNFLPLQKIDMIGKAHSSDQDDYVYHMRGRSVSAKQVNSSFKTFESYENYTLDWNNFVGRSFFVYPVPSIRPT